MEVSLEKEDYNESDLITIKIPLSLPYQNDWSHFERANGEISFKGRILKYVKRKISNGQLVLLCITDNNKIQLQSVKNNFFKSTNELGQNNQSKKSENSKSGTPNIPLGDYFLNRSDYSCKLNLSPIAFNLIRLSDNLPSRPHNSPEQPPDYI